MTKRKLASNATPQLGSPAFIAGLLSHCRHSTDDLAIESFKELEPAQMKRWLDFVAEQHGDLEHWSAQDIADTIWASRHRHHVAILKGHALDYMNLALVYMAKGSTDARVITNYEKDEDEDQGEYERASKGEGKDQDEAIVADCVLEVPSCGSGFPFQSWGIIGGASSGFAGIQQETVVYLKATFLSADCRTVYVSLGDNIFWFDEGRVVAAGRIKKVLEGSIVITDDGLIVPVVAQPFRYRFSSIQLLGDTFEEHGQEWRDFVRESREQNTIQKAPSTPWTLESCERPLPKLACMINSSSDCDLGCDVLNDIDAEFVGKRNIARQAVSAQRRANLDAFFEK